MSFLIFKIIFSYLDIFALPLFPPNTKIKKKISILSSFFHPPPGSLVEVDSEELHRKNDNPLSYQGFIRVIPPLGHCFAIGRNTSVDELVICKEEDVEFSLSQLSSDGKISWRIVTSENDPGTQLVWPTPYRLAQVIKSGEGNLTFGHKVPIRSCHADISGGRRSIILRLLDGSKWSIRFPPKDSWVDPDAKPPPNLLVRKAKKKIFGLGINEVDGATKKSDQTPKADDKTKQMDGSEKSADKPQRGGNKKQEGLSWVDRLKGVKKNSRVTYKFNMKEYQAFTMKSDGFTTESTPKPMNGKCRYRFFGAYDEPTIGLIECYNTDSFDAIEAPLTCSLPLLKDQIARGMKLDIPWQLRPYLDQ